MRIHGSIRRALMAASMAAAVVTGTLTCPRSVAGQMRGAAFVEFLEQHIGLSRGELRKVERGDVVTRALDTENTEVAIFGIVRIGATPDEYLEQYRDIERFESGKGVLQVRRFSDPPMPEDLESLVFPPKDLDALAKCKPGSCEVKIDEGSLKRLQTEVDWQAPDARAQAARLAKRLLFDYVEAYRTGGNQRLAFYRDQKRPTFVAREFEGLVANSPYLPQYQPDLHRYLLEFPTARPPLTEEFFYWSKVNFGLRDTIRLNHVVIHRPTESPDEVVIASKMLYASHYFHTALELTFVFPDRDSASTMGSYLMMLQRSRSDGLTGLFGGAVRSQATSAALKGLGARLKDVRRRLSARPASADTATR